MNILLWIIQIILALLFVASGGMKLVMSTEALLAMGPPSQIVFPAWFYKFIGLCEVLGGLGLVLPGLFRRQQHLTPLAALGLTIIMIGAVVTSAMAFGFSGAIVPLITGLLCLFVAYGRSKLQPHN
jgi:uncharacterized membrane protein YphA (DoxX/SURF4 family)